MIKYLTDGSMVRREETELSDILTTESADHILGLPWVKDGHKVTCYFPHFMQKAKQGYIRYINNQWEIHAGSNMRTAKKLHIPMLNQNIHVYISEQKIVPDWKRHKHMESLAKMCEQCAKSQHCCRFWLDPRL